MRDTWLTLNPHALTQNLAVLRAHHSQSKLLAMVKADAYGHGVAQVAPLLATQVDAFGVAFLEEALALRAQGINTPIAVLEGVFTAAELAAARTAQLSLAVHSPEQVALLQAAPAQSHRVPRKNDPTATRSAGRSIHRLGRSAS